MKSFLLSALFCIAFFTQITFAQTTATDLVFNIEVTTSNVLPSITLKWNKQASVTSYNILKKNRTSKTFTMLASNVSVNDTVFTDNNVVVGTGYEYCIQSASDVNISGYVYAGMQLPEVHQAGELLLIIDNTYQLSASFELEAYKLDLIKEGWKVSTSFVSRTQSAASVKQLITAKYNQNPTTLKGVILLGHVPIPYSGNIAPDAHSDHIGAWPCDMYYGDINSTTSDNWTDITLNTSSATDPRNHNTIGDGKFDASNKATTSAVKLFVGRVDVYNMPAINTDDTFLFKQYLAKNHAYRCGAKKFRQKGIVDDNFGYFAGEAFAQNGWRNFSSLVGSSNVSAGDYITDTKTNSYIWSYACGPGWYTGAQGIGTTNDFTSNQMQSAFTMIYGSYFGDWDNQNNFLRAPIASPSASLVSIWGGRPNWFLHTMAMGEPIGYSYINSVDNANTYFPKGFYANKVHQNLQGDPSLKMYVFEAPSNVFTASIDNDTKVQLNWTASPDPNVIGYYVYRATSIDDDFTLLNPTYVTSTEFVDVSQGLNTAGIYMVRAVKLETSTTGTFYNLSPGATSLENPMTATVLPVTISSFNGYANTNSTNTLYWDVKNETNVASYQVERSVNGQAFESIGAVEAKTNASNENSYSFVDANPSMETSYRLKNVDIDAKSAYSNIIVLRRAAIKADIAVYPSPFSSYLNIVYSSEITSTLSVQVRDISGKIVMTQQATVAEGQNNIRLSDLDKLTKGLYIVVVTDSETNEKNVFKVMKE